jgi:hypothetical protein
VRSAAVEVEAIYDNRTRASHYRAFTDTARIVRIVAWRLIRRGFYPLGLLRVLRAHTRAASSKRSMLPEKNQEAARD